MRPQGHNVLSVDLGLVSYILSPSVLTSSVLEPLGQLLQFRVKHLSWIKGDREPTQKLEKFAHQFEVILDLNRWSHMFLAIWDMETILLNHRERERKKKESACKEDGVSLDWMTKRDLKNISVVLRFADIATMASFEDCLFFFPLAHWFCPMYHQNWSDVV